MKSYGDGSNREDSERRKERRKPFEVADVARVDDAGSLRGERRDDRVGPAEDLWRAGSIEGAVACGFDDAGRTLPIRRDPSTLDLVDDALLLDAVVFSGGSATVESVED